MALRFAIHNRSSWACRRPFCFSGWKGKFERLAVGAGRGWETLGWRVPSLDYARDERESRFLAVSGELVEPRFSSRGALRQAQG